MIGKFLRRRSEKPRNLLRFCLGPQMQFTCPKCKKDLGRGHTITILIEGKSHLIRLGVGPAWGGDACECNEVLRLPTVFSSEKEALQELRTLEEKIGSGKLPFFVALSDESSPFVH